ncbi:MAG: hypothetical protein MUD01_29290 [Chloroflexaceae bacterium]|nr:hypothetical protein [Chloroflexaceae bacterium]
MKLVLWVGILSLIVTLSHLIPFNIPVLLLFLPLTFVFPQLAQTGAEVTYGFAWLEIHAFWVWAVLFIWHFILLLPIVWLFLLLVRKLKQAR